MEYLNSKKFWNQCFCGHMFGPFINQNSNIMTTKTILKIAILSFITSNVSAQNWSLTPQNHLINTNHGNVGIGSGTPGAVLDVQGQSYIQGSGFIDVAPGTGTSGCVSQPILKVVGHNGGSIMEGCPPANLVEFGIDHGFGTENKVVLDEKGNLGVGINIVPTNTLDIDGQIRMRQGAQNGFLAVSDQDGNLTWTSPTAILSTGAWAQNADTVFARNNDLAISIGTSRPRPGYKLSVNGKVVCTELRVLEYKGWDRVFEDDYNLRPLSEVKSYIEEHKHLPDLNSAANYEAGGIDLSEMNGLLLRKIEELTLYLIDLEEQVENLQAAVKN